MELLLTHGASLNPRTADHLTPLHLACQYNHKDVREGGRGGREGGGRRGGGRERGEGGREGGREGGGREGGREGRGGGREGGREGGGEGGRGGREGGREGGRRGGGEGKEESGEGGIAMERERAVGSMSGLGMRLDWGGMEVGARSCIYTHGAKVKVGTAVTRE